ncbi:carboxymuconolactone decarboxylase family protein [Chelatococcus sambhunathii]|uniref:Carboxymuconolactone decarboxylase family protein n=1 Tax=Chelatococcus sambhunathii TaxID=363953 RepID=A0ABU1DHK6_9HYPH|nr:carboxymuconolactone decarboxylase family protein [Chelatococcus sambhunathii]MDR4307608.1 carboxymuconolactone decarboxylase family protein [Chelatococcus sambhunathii]
MPRVTPLPSSALPAHVAELYERFAAGYGDFRDQAAVLAHCPTALEGLYGMLIELREKANLPLRYVELAVVTVSKLNACPYCVAQHEPLLEIEGVPAEAIAELPRFDHPALEDADRLVIEYATLVTTRAWGLRDAIFERLRASFSESQIVELTLRIALAGFFNRFNDALQIDDGRAAAASELPRPPSS